MESLEGESAGEHLEEEQQPLSSEASVNLETDFEQSIDEINIKRIDCNGLQRGIADNNNRKRRSVKNPDYRDQSDSEESTHNERNGYLVSSPTKKKKNKVSNEKIIHGALAQASSVSVKPARGGKPFSHQMRQASSSKAALPKLVVKSSGGKPRSMLEIVSSSSINNKKQLKHAKSFYYQSQITEDKNTIKIKIKKSNANVKKPKRRKSHESTLQMVRDKQSLKDSSGAHKKRKHKEQGSRGHKESDGSAQQRVPVNKVVVPSADMLPTVVVVPSVTKPKDSKKKSIQSKASKSQHKPSEERPPVVQGPWGSSIPQELLVKIFSYVVAQQGSLPSVVKFGQVCRLWHAASITPSLWTNMELSQFTKDKYNVEHRLVWLLENRLSMCHQLNLANWKVANVDWVVKTIVSCCPHLEDVNLTGWTRLSVAQLWDITQGLTKLARLDLSCTSEASSSGGCLSVVSLTQVSKSMGERLTHLTLANNKLAGLPVILNSVADYCPNLELLDLSNLWAVSHPATVPLERLQKGCTKLKVLRITNSQVVLAMATTHDQMDSPGFPMLEELSVACPSVDYKLVNDEALGRILKGSTCLRLLDVRGCIRITDSGLIKVPAWDLQHLFLSGCAVTRQNRSCLELICEKWSHSLVEVDLAWSTAAQPLNAAVEALAEKGAQSKLRILNLCGSPVSLEPVRKLLIKCPNLESVNLASCRALPRGMKRHYMGKELKDLKDSFDPVKKKEKEEQERLAKERKKKALEEAKKSKEKGKAVVVDVEGEDDGQCCENDKTQNNSTVIEVIPSVNNNDSVSVSSVAVSSEHSQQEYSPQVNANSSLSPQPSTSDVSTPRSNVQDSSPASSSQAATDPIIVSKCTSAEMSGRLGNKQEALSSTQPSPDTRYSPANTRQGTPKSTGSWNVGNYSPSVTSQGSPYPSHSPSVHQQESPYSSQNSPSVMRQESPYSSQKSPSVASPYSSQIRSPSVVRQESPYSSVKSPSVPRQEASPYSSHVSPSVARQESPYSAHSPSVVRQESPYSSHVSPSVRQESPYSSHVSPSMARQESPYSSHVSPSMARQESPYSSHVSPSVARQGSPYPSQKSPYQSVKSPYTSQKSPDPPVQIKPNHTPGWNVEQYSPVVRQESASSSQPSPETGPQAVSRPWNIERFSPMQSNTMMPSPDTSQVSSTGKQWNLDRFSPMARVESSPAAAPSPEMYRDNIKPTNSQPWHLGHPITDTGQGSLKASWNAAGHFSSSARAETTPTGVPHQDTHKWNLNHFSSKMDNSNVMSNRLRSSVDPLPSIWGGTSASVSNAYISDQVTTTTYCANPDQTLYRNFRDPINGPSSVD